MCGICGIVYSYPARPVAQDMLRRMTASLQHRGPDSHGFYHAPGVGLGIRRLSIIDLETGDQPISNEDGTIIVVCNGEIYNFQELRQQLQAAGHRFKTHSDIEVIVHLYEEHGVECVQYLRGMFGFALWDVRQRRLMLARDRFGIKPLFYAAETDGVCFGSELKPILMSGRVERQIDIQALQDIFTIGFVLAPKTLFSKIRRVLPGHYLLYQDGQLSTHQYWDVRFPTPDDASPCRSAEEWAEALRVKLEESVRLHLRSDVPVGAWLSSGIDSSAVVSLMRRMTDRPVQTFTLAFENPRFDEVSTSKILSDFPDYNLVNQRAVCTTKDFDRLRKAVWHCEDPLALGIDIPRMVLSQLAAHHVKVVLTGEGSDEVFGGYPWFHTHTLIQPFTRLPHSVRRYIARIPAVSRAWPRASRILRAPAAMNLVRYKQTIDSTNQRFDNRLFADDLRQQLLQNDAAEDMLSLPPDFDRWHSFAQLQYLEIHVRLPNFITRYLDATSMAYGLEVRVPFLDHEFVEFCAQIPPALKLHGGQEKYILRQALCHDLPRDILQRKKRGMAAPYSQWVRHLPAFAAELLSPERLRETGYFAPQVVRHMLEQHRTKRADYGKSLLGVLGVHLWDDLFLKDY